MKTLNEILSKAETEEELKNFVAKFFHVRLSTKNFIDLYTPQILFEFKLDAPLKIIGAQKTALRQSLLEEQGYLCAYCMSKICDKVKIEHYEPRNPQNELEYSNLLTVCTGNSAGNGI